MIFCQWWRIFGLFKTEFFCKNSISDCLAVVIFQSISSSHWIASLYHVFEFSCSSSEPIISIMVILELVPGAAIKRLVVVVSAQVGTFQVLQYHTLSGAVYLNMDFEMMMSYSTLKYFIVTLLTLFTHCYK